MNNQLIWMYLYGPTDMGYNPIEMIFWLAMLTPIWVIIGYVLSVKSNQCSFVVYRYKSKVYWWKSLLIKVFSWHTGYFLGLGLIFGLHIRTDGLRLSIIILLLYIHSLAMVALMLWIYLLLGKLTIAVIILIILEAVSKLFINLGMAPQTMPLVWGMYGYSNQYIDGGFDCMAVIGIQIVFLVVTCNVPMRYKRLIPI